MIDDYDAGRAGRMYPDQQVKESQPVPHTPGESDAMVDRLYQPQPEAQKGNPYSLEPDSVEDRLYGGEAKLTLSDHVDLSFAAASGQETETLKSNLSFMGSEVGAQQSDIEDLVSHARTQLIGGAKFNAQESLSILHEQHGNRLPQLLEDPQVGF